MDLIEDGVTGYLVDVGNTSGLTNRLIEILRASRTRLAADV